MFPTRSLLPLAAAAALLVPEAAAQVFVRNTASVPTSTGFTENVDFGDVDNDGDWDAAFANGGDVGNQQNRLWINQGFAQGGTLGVFVDETTTRCPAIADSSRDIEFADYDGDGDLDLADANHCAVTTANNGSRFWTNVGGAQGGSIGFYQDETIARWVGLGGPGSSMPPTLVIPSGGFNDHSPDVEFGDLDSDGDLDLVHVSYGGAFSGQVPTRVFLNDGAGFFSEFNPSGFQLPGTNIANGNPGLWCEGLQQANTTNADGTFCDIASSALDADVGDIDGDLDLDLLHGARQELPRMFANRLVENGGSLSFRDVTGAVFPPGYAVGNGKYEQELGDFDADGDLDICGLNWLSPGFQFNDVILKNNGDGTYAPPVALPSSASDDNEVDCIDYDADGDLDLFVANFSGQDRMYQNDGTGTYVFMPTGTVLPSDSTISLDADMGDADGDADYDLFVANDSNQPEWYLQNTGDVPDTSAPVLLRLEQAPDRAASGAPTAIRVQVYDNTAYYTTWYDDAALEVSVDGGPLVSYPMRSSMGQIFRGEIDGRLVGTVQYRAVASDPYGNTGQTGFLSYVATPGSPTGTAFCFGDGSLATPCPCGNTGQTGRGCDNSAGTGGARLSAIGTTVPDTLALTADGLLASVPAIFLQGTSSIPAGVAFGDGVRCAGGNLKRLALEVAVQGAVNYPGANDPSVSARSALLGDPIAPGSSRFYQVYYRDPVLGFCPTPTGNAWNVSSGVALVW